MCKRKTNTITELNGIDGKGAHKATKRTERERENKKIWEKPKRAKNSFSFWAWVVINYFSIYLFWALLSLWIDSIKEFLTHYGSSAWYGVRCLYGGGYVRHSRQIFSITSAIEHSSRIRQQYTLPVSPHSYIPYTVFWRFCVCSVVRFPVRFVRLSASAGPAIYLVSLPI